MIAQIPLLALLWLHSATSLALGNRGSTLGYRSVAYYVNWAIYGRSYNPQDLPADTLTHVLYAFANVRPDTGQVYLSDIYADLEKHYSNDSWSETGKNVYGCIKQLYLLKKRHRKLKVLLSIGGWTYSPNFVSGTSTNEKRMQFVTSAMQLVQDLGFDGLDIDWEYPQNRQEAQSLVQLLAEIRQASDDYARVHGERQHFILTVAAPAGPMRYEILDIPSMDRYLDFWNLMAYDYATGLDDTSGHTSNVFHSCSQPSSTKFNTEQAIAYYSSHGVDTSRIVLGMPLYGRSFLDTTGPGEPFNGVGSGSWEDGAWDFKELPLPGAVEHEDWSIIASYSYDSEKKMMVSYDTQLVATWKAEYIMSKGLGGGMWWESSGDKTGNNSLVTTVVNTLGGIAALDHTPNQLFFPASTYENMRKGFPDE